MATAVESTKVREIASPRVPIHTLTGVQILGTGAYLPPEVVRNEDLAALGYDDKWIIQRTGIRERRRASAAMATSDLAWEAACRCLDSAGAAAADVDLILVATVTPDSPMPSTACQLQRRLGGQAAAMDLNAACSGFVFALATAAQFVKNGCSRLALVVGAEIMTRIVNPRDKKTYPLFGDAAGAVLVGAGHQEQGLLAYSLGADGQGADLLHIPAGGSREPMCRESLSLERQFLRMDGRSVFKWAVRTVGDSVREVLAHTGVPASEVDVIALHQANIRILDAVSHDLGFEADKVIVNLSRYGNTSAASVPLVLDEAAAMGRLTPGALVLMSGFGAGLTWGTALIRW